MQKERDRHELDGALAEKISVRACMCLCAGACVRGRVRVFGVSPAALGVAWAVAAEVAARRDGAEAAVRARQDRLSEEGGVRLRWAAPRINSNDGTNDRRRSQEDRSSERGPGSRLARLCIRTLFVTRAGVIALHQFGNARHATGSSVPSAG